MPIHHAIPSIDLDVHGYPLDFQLDSVEGCSGHYWYEREWLNGKRRYNSVDRTIDYDSFNNRWNCRDAPAGDSLRVDCTNDNLFHCTKKQDSWSISKIYGMRIQYDIIANQSNGWYSLHTVYPFHSVYRRKDTRDDRYIYYDMEDNQWKISDSIGGITTYATCDQSNFFSCDFVTTGANRTSATPTVQSVPTFAPFTKRDELFCDCDAFDYFSLECGDDRMCYYMNIYPRNGANTSFDLDIQTNISNQTQIDVFIKPYDYHCKNTTFSIHYYDHQSIDVYSNNSLIMECNNNTITTGECPQWQTCIDHSKIAIEPTSLMMGSIHKMTLSLATNAHLNTSDIECNLRNLSTDITLSIQCHHSYETNTISCSNGTECRNTTVECPRDGDCFINCTTSYHCSSIDCSACYQSIFICPEARGCAVICQGHYSCANTIFYGAISHVTCVGDHACAFSGFYYNSHRHNKDALHVCEGENACVSAQFVPHEEASLNVICHKTSCVYTAFYCLSSAVVCNVTCDGCHHCSFYVYVGSEIYLTISNLEESEIITYDSHAIDYPILRVHSSTHGNHLEEYLRLQPVNISADVCKANCTIWVMGPTKDVLPIWIASTDPLDLYTQYSLFYPWIAFSIILFLYIVIVIVIFSKGNKHYWAPIMVVFHFLSNISWIYFAVFCVLIDDELGWFLLVLIISFWISTLLALTAFGIRIRYHQSWILLLICSVCADYCSTLLLLKIKLFGTPVSLRDIRNLLGFRAKRSRLIRSRCLDIYFRSGVLIAIPWLYQSYVFVNVFSAASSAYFCMVVAVIYDLIITAIMYTSHRWKNHIAIEMKLQLFGHDEDAQLNIFDSKMIDYEGAMTKQIQSYVPTSNCIVEVVNVGTTDQKNEVDLSLSVEWDSDTSKLDIQNYLEETLSDFKYSNALKTFLNSSQNASLKRLKVVIEGDATTDEMREYLINKLYEPILKECQYTIEEPIALKNMNRKHIIDLVSYYILNDDKYKLHSAHVMGLIQEAHIDGAAMTEQIEKGVDIEQYLDNILGGYINREILSKIAINITQDDARSEMNTQSIFQTICMFAIENLKAEWRSKQIIDGQWIIEHMNGDQFVDELRSVTALDRDDCLQIHRSVVQYYVKSSEDQIMDRVEQIFTNYDNVENVRSRDKTDNKLNKKQTETCQRKHVWKQFRTPEAGYGCDECESNGFPKLVIMFRCRVCGYAICRSCLNASDNSQSSGHTPNCPGKHGLKQFRTPSAKWWCDGCTAISGNKSQLAEETIMFGCRTCKYDLCDSCFNGDDKVDLNNQINFEELAVKLKNNVPIHQESAMLLNFIENRLQRTSEKMVNRILMEVAGVFCDLCLDDWWCSECLYHNRIIKINGKMLTPNHDLMHNCIVCGCEKVLSIFNTLKGETKTNVFISDTIFQSKMNDDLKCKLYDKEDIALCTHYRRMIDFLKSNSESEIQFLDYVDALENLTHEELINDILLPSIDHMDRHEAIDASKLRTLFKDDLDEKESLFDDGKFLLRLTQSALHDIIMNRDADDHPLFDGDKDEKEPLNDGKMKHPSTRCIPSLYQSILKQIDVFISQKQRKLVGASYAEIVFAWNHLMESHDIHQIFGDEFVCNDANCGSASRRSQRRQKRGRSMSRKRRFADDCAFSEHTKTQILIYDHYKHDLDSIHYGLLHRNSNGRTIDACGDIKEEQHSIDVFDEEKELDEGILRTGTTLHALLDEDMKDETIEDDSRYNTSIGLYGFGVDHQHHHLGPQEENTCFKKEVNDNKLWYDMLLKAMAKYKLIMNNARYRSRQFSEDYNINRGDPIGIHHILSICIYTDCSDLCREYRETYRRIETDKNQDDIRRRHRKYYFWSRFLFEAIEFYGDVMRTKDVVYHGLDQQLLFSNFSTHFNAPMSTTPDSFAVQNFTKGRGIILTLRNGNKHVSKEHKIAIFEPNRPRYLQVNWISAFPEEKEWLFFGTATLFEVLNIEYVADRKQIPLHTLKQLNLLQLLIKGKMIEWNQMPTRVKVLARRLCVIRALNMELLRYNDSMDHIDYLWSYLGDNHTQFIDSFRQWFETNDYDAQSLKQDIGELGDKKQSNLYMFLVSNGYGLEAGKYFDIIYHLLREHEQMQIKQQVAPYWKKLFQYFVVSQREFICIRQPFGIPIRLQNELFREEKPMISIAKLTDLFYNVTNIAFTELSFVTMTGNCSKFCKSMISYADQYEERKSKKLKFVEFKTKHLDDSKLSVLLQKCAQKYDQKSANVEIKYVFQYEQQHILRFSIN